MQSETTNRPAGSLEASDLLLAKLNHCISYELAAAIAALRCAQTPSRRRSAGTLLNEAIEQWRNSRRCTGCRRGDA